MKIKFALLATLFVLLIGCAAAPTPVSTYYKINTFNLNDNYTETSLDSNGAIIGIRNVKFVWDGFEPKIDPLKNEELVYLEIKKIGSSSFSVGRF